MEPLVGLPGGREVQPVREVRVLRGPQLGRHLRHVAAVQVPVHGLGRGGVPRGRARPRSPDAGARPGAVHDLVRRRRLARGGRRPPAARGQRLRAHRRRAELRLLRRPHRSRPGRPDRGGVRAVGRARAPGPSVARPARRARSRRRPAPVLRPRQGEDRRQAGHRLAHRVHRRRGLRGVGEGRRRARGVGRGVGGEPGPRRPAVRPPGAVHDPHRGRPAPARRRLPQQPVRLDGRRPRDAPRARPRLDAPGRRGGRAAVHRPRCDPA